MSTVDDNTSLPTDDRYWKDFFVAQDTSKFKSEILAQFTSHLSSYLSSHLEEYHLSGMQSWLKNAFGSSSLSASYLLKTLENVSDYQEYTPGNGVVDTGFDYVVYF